MSTPDVLKELAPTGTLRASINLGNIVLANGTPDNPGGVTPELARELAKRLGVPCKLTCFDAAGKAFEAMKPARSTSCSWRSSRCAPPRSSSPRPM